MKTEIVVGRVKTYLKNLIKDRNTIIITDKNVHGLYHDIISEYQTITISCGEKNKNHYTVCQIYSELLRLGADRSTLLIGFGGGVVTDITGFVASTYMRGISCGYIPTTLLSQVDASIGGKTGINYEGYKNMVGTFSQPEFILTDHIFLNTLNKLQIISGMAEIIKIAIIGDTVLFEMLENKTLEEIYNDKRLLEDIITRAVGVKCNVVSKDEQEKGVRKLLNLGHTIGHAIESCVDRYTHGEAVGMGISIIAELSVDLGYLTEQDEYRINRVLSSMGITLRDKKLNMADIYRAIEYDKKKNGNLVDLVLIRTVGKCDVVRYRLQELSNFLLF